MSAGRWTTDRAAASPLAQVDAANRTAQAIMELLAQARKRSVTIQWMPEDERGGCRFEVIRVHDGELIGVARVDAAGAVRLEEA